MSGATAASRKQKVTSDDFQSDVRHVQTICAPLPPERSAASWRYRSWYLHGHSVVQVDASPKHLSIKKQQNPTTISPMKEGEKKKATDVCRLLSLSFHEVVVFNLPSDNISRAV